MHPTHRLHAWLSGRSLAMKEADTHSDMGPAAQPAGQPTPQRGCRGLCCWCGREVVLPIAHLFGLLSRGCCRLLLQVCMHCCLGCCLQGSWHCIMLCSPEGWPCHGLQGRSKAHKEHRWQTRLQIAMLHARTMQLNMGLTATILRCQRCGPQEMPKTMLTMSQRRFRPSQCPTWLPCLVCWLFSGRPRPP